MGLRNYCARCHTPQQRCREQLHSTNPPHTNNSTGVFDDSSSQVTDMHISPCKKGDHSSQDLVCTTHNRTPWWSEPHSPVFFFSPPLTGSAQPTHDITSSVFSVALSLARTGLRQGLLSGSPPLQPLGEWLAMWFLVRWQTVSCVHRRRLSDVLPTCTCALWFGIWNGV